MPELGIVGRRPHEAEEATRDEIPADRWDAVAATVRARLRRSARRGRRIAYRTLIAGLPFSGPNSHALAEMLGEISTESVAAGGPMLSAVAVYLSSDERGTPGPGFYSLATTLGRLAPNAGEVERYWFWRNEVQRCFGHAGRRHTTRSHAA